MPEEDKLDKIRRARGVWDWSNPNQTQQVIWSKDLFDRENKMESVYRDLSAHSIMLDKSSQSEKSDKSRVKDTGRLSPDLMLEYLVSKDVPLFHALGIISNVKYESNFNPNAIGDRGTSAGLFQHHNTRKDALMNYIGNDLSNWQKQIDYMLTENDTKSYLSQQFESPEQASYWFTKNWERPSNKEVKAVQRQSFFSTFDGGKYYTGTYNPNSTSTSTKTLSTPEAYGMPEGTDLQGFSEADFKAAVDREVEKVVETEKKNQESEARKKIEELKKAKEQQFLQSAVSNVMTAMAKAVNESGRSETTEQTDLSALYQTPNIPIQGANMPRLQAFSDGGVVDNNSSQGYQNIFKYADGGTVSEVWQSKTGLPWSEASKLGFTDGTYEANIALRKRLLSGDLDIIGSEEKKLTPNQLKKTIDSASTFKDAFSVARQELGPNRLFEFEGRVYGTNLPGEELNPPEEDIKKFKLDKKYTEKRLTEENKKLESPYSSKETVKVEPEWEDWEKIKETQAEVNRMNNAEKIISYKKQNPDGKNFAIVDKKKGLLHIYNSDGSMKYSAPMDVDTGLNPGDAQTVTKYRDLNNDGITNPNEVKGSNVDWSAGNKSTGAGIFYISNIDKEGYGGLPILNMMNERQYDEFEKTGQINNVSTSFHKGFINDGDPRASNGCVRCNKPTLDRLVASLDNSSQVFILPEDANNEFTVQNNKLVFLPKSDKNYDQYVDERGEDQSGQGINRSVNTLNYLPIIPEVDFDKIQLNSTNKSTKDWGVGTNKSADDQKERVNEFVKALSDNKKQIMKYAKVNGDVYNEIAKMAFGILGSESDYAALYDNFTNTAKGLNRLTRGGNVGGTDYKFEYDYRESDKDKGWNSLGMTQLVWNQLEEKEKKLLENLGVNRISQLTEPKKAAVATAALLAYRFNNRSFEKQDKDYGTFPFVSPKNQLKSTSSFSVLSEKSKKKDKVKATVDDMWTYLPTTWNNREGYADRVKANSKPLSLKQLNDPDKIKEFKDGEKQAEAFVNKVIKTRELSPSESVGISNQKQLDKAIKKKRQAKWASVVEDTPDTRTSGRDFRKEFKEDLEAPNQFWKNNKSIVGTNLNYEDGGVYDLTDEEIQKLEEGGYKIEYLD